VWRRLAPMLHRLGVLTEIDVPMLVALCEVWCGYQSALKESLKRAVPSSTRVQWSHVADRKFGQYTQTLAKFGMSPSDRSRIEVTVPALGNQTPAAIAAATPARPMPGAGFGAERVRRVAAVAEIPPPEAPTTPPPTE
jgi:P27 family predicted phage terminase small subunit